jgi:hypothetical protein
MKDEPDRCGYGIFSTNKEDPFHPACVVHDRDYVDGTISREEADRRFRLAMWERVEREPRWYRRIVLAARAAAYEAAVGIFGPMIRR